MHGYADRHLARGAVARHPRHRRQRALSSAPAHGRPRLARRRVGHERQQSPRAVLPAHRRGATAPAHRIGDVAPLHEVRHRHSRARAARHMTRAYRRLVDLALGGRRRVDAEMDQEIESHLEMRVADLVRAGMSPEAARDEAKRRFGDFDAAQATTACRRAPARCIGAASRRARVASSPTSASRARQARRAPGFTAHRRRHARARPRRDDGDLHAGRARRVCAHCPSRAPSRLLSMSGLDSAGNARRSRSRRPTGSIGGKRADRCRRARSIRFRSARASSSATARCDCRSVSATGGLFDVLGSHFVAGRPFNESDARDGANVVVISERLWRQMFGADPSLGDEAAHGHARTTPSSASSQTAKVSPRASTSGFPWSSRSSRIRRASNINWLMIARVEPGATPERARAELGGIARGIRERDPTALYDFGVSAQSLTESVVGGVSDYFQMLMATVGVVLLIVCANVAASSAARAQTRVREMAVRSSLGAVRGRLVQQLLSRARVAWPARRRHRTRARVACDPRRARGLGQPDSARGRKSRWTGASSRSRSALSLVAGVLAGIIPARARDARVAERHASVRRARRREGRTQPRRRVARESRDRAGAAAAHRRGTADSELSLACCRATSASTRTSRPPRRRSAGRSTRRTRVRRYMYWDQLLDEFRAIPGVQAAAVSQWIPLGLTGQGFVDVEGRDATRRRRRVPHGERGFLSNAAHAARRRAARSTGDDGIATTRVVVINRVMATKFFPGENPIGRRVRARSQEPGVNGQPAPWLTIVGVVGDIRTYGLESDARAEMYVYFRQTPWRTTSMTALVRGSGSAAELVGEMRRRARTRRLARRGRRRHAGRPAERDARHPVAGHVAALGVRGGRGAARGARDLRRAVVRRRAADARARRPHRARRATRPA